MNIKDIENAIREFIGMYCKTPEVIFLKPETVTKLVSEWGFMLNLPKTLEEVKLVTLFGLKIQYSKDFEGVGLIKTIKNIKEDDEDGRKNKT